MRVVDLRAHSPRLHTACPDTRGHAVHAARRGREGAYRIPSTVDAAIPAVTIISRNPCAQPSCKGA